MPNTPAKRLSPPHQRFTLPSSYPPRRRGTPSKTGASLFRNLTRQSPIIWIRRDDPPEEGRRKLVGQLIARESSARAWIVKTITVKPFGPILTQPAIAIMDRRVGITRCRAPILLSCLCLDSCTRVHPPTAFIAPLCSRFSRERERGERERERESDHPRFLERVFFTSGAKGVRLEKGFRDPQRVFPTPRWPS